MEQVIVWLALIAIGLSLEAVLASREVDRRRLLINMRYGGIALACTMGTTLALVHFFETTGTGLPYLFDFSHYDPLPQAIALGVAATVLGDLIYYTWHRAQHVQPLLWKIHRVHHSDSDFDVTTYVRQSWLEGPIQVLIIVLPLHFIARLPEASYFTMGVLLNFLVFFSHLAIPLKLGRFTRLVIGPDLHRTHHFADRSWSGANFAGVTPVWDIVFGTYRAPPAESHNDADVRKAAHP